MDYFEYDEKENRITVTKENWIRYVKDQTDKMKLAYNTNSLIALVENKSPARFSFIDPELVLAHALGTLEVSKIYTSMEYVNHDTKLDKVEVLTFSALFAANVEFIAIVPNLTEACVHISKYGCNPKLFKTSQTV